MLLISSIFIIPFPIILRILTFTQTPSFHVILHTKQLNCRLSHYIQPVVKVSQNGTERRSGKRFAVGMTYQ